MEFLNNLTESKMIPSIRSLRKYTAKDTADLVFLFFVAVQILKNEFEYLDFTTNYATVALRYGGFDKVRIGGSNDMAIMISHLVSSDTFADEKNSKLYINKLRINELEYKKYLRRIKSGQTNHELDRQFFIKLIRDLNITDATYLAMRRLAVEWGTGKLDEMKKKLTMTRLLMAFRHRARRADIIGSLEKLSRKDKLELKNACNVETGDNCDDTARVKQKFGLLKTLGMAAAGGVGGWYVGKKMFEREQQQVYFTDDYVDVIDLPHVKDFLKHPIVKRINLPEDVESSLFDILDAASVIADENDDKKLSYLVSRLGFTPGRSKFDQLTDDGKKFYYQMVELKETTTSGSVAVVAMPLGATMRRPMPNGIKWATVKYGNKRVNDQKNDK
ncbi:MAG: hypothetical protein WC284_07785 [Candidimonas sp.]